MYLNPFTCHKLPAVGRTDQVAGSDLALPRCTYGADSCIDLKDTTFEREYIFFRTGDRFCQPRLYGLRKSSSYPLQSKQGRP